MTRQGDGHERRRPLIFYPQDSNRDPDYIGPSITTVAQLLYGQSDAAGGNVNVQLLRCNNYADCDVVSRTNANAHEPLTKKVEERDAQHLGQHPHARSHPEQLGRGRVREQHQHPGLEDAVHRQHHSRSGLSEMMIGNYREVIAADYAFTFLNQFANVAPSALMKQHLLNDVQKQLAQLQREMSTKFLEQAAAGAVEHVTRRSSQCRPSPPILNGSRRNLRSNMSTHVLDMLGHLHRGIQ